MRINVYDYNSYKDYKNHKKIEHKCIGYIDADTFNAAELFNICNWFSAGKEKPDCLHANIVAVGSGICFENPETGEMWLSKSFGWVVGSKEDIKRYVSDNRGKIAWI